MPRKNPLESSALEEPVFVRGFDPASHQWKPPPRPFRWKRHLELGRQNPARWNPATQQFDGGWMLVAEVKKGGCKDREQRIETDRDTIQIHLNKFFPLEVWELRRVTVAGTWCDRELYMRYLGTQTLEERELKIKLRRETWELRRAKSAEKKARRAREARQKALEEEAAAQVKIRSRRRPGQ